MRLSKDATSWKASGLIRKLRAIPDEPLRRGAKKNTRRWCKGKVGVEHDYQRREKPWAGTSSVSLKACTKCGKEDWRTIRYPRSMGGTSICQ